MLLRGFLAGLLVLALLKNASGDLVKLNNCAVKLENGDIIDLSRLSNAKNPMNITVDGYNYLFNPCDPVDCHPASQNTSAFCQKSLDGQFVYDIGDQDLVEFIQADTNPAVYLSATTYDGNRKVVMSCICSENENFTFASEKPMRNYNFNLYSKCCCPNGCALKKPKKLSSCSAQLDDGSIIDLSNLDNSANPRTDSDDRFKYLYNPCSPIYCDMYNNTALCQNFKADPRVYFDMGDQNTVEFVLDVNKNLFLYYVSSTDKIRNSFVKCVCAQNESFQFQGENPPLTYNFVLESYCCCPNGCSQKPKKLSSCSAQLSDGSIIDLSSLDNSASPRKTTNPDYPDYTFYYNPCSPLSCTTGIDSAVCQHSFMLAKDFNLGDQNTTSFSIDSNKNLVMSFQSNDGTFIRNTDITCVCDKEENFSFIAENPQRHYSFTFSSPCCCPGGCSGGGGNVKKLGPCTGQLNNGSVIDLSSLDRPQNPRESDMGSYKYFFNPCSPIECSSNSNDTAFCQKSSTGGSDFSLGEQASSAFKFDDNDDFLVIQYKSSYRTSNLLCICADEELFTFVNEYPVLNYTFVLYSPCCCAGGCASSEGPKKINNCKAQYSDGSIVDLKSLDSPTSPLLANTKEYSFYFNPCSRLEYPSYCASLSPYIGICQVGVQAYFDLGDQNVDFKLDTDNTLLMVYRAQTRTSTIRCVCDEDSTGFYFIEESPILNYKFELRSKCCCKNGC